MLVSQNRRVKIEVRDYTWSISSGALPAGLTLSGGTISGTPTNGGTSFTVQVTDNIGFAATKELSITIACD